MIRLRDFLSALYYACDDFYEKRGGSYDDFIEDIFSNMPGSLTFLGWTFSGLHDFWASNPFVYPYAIAGQMSKLGNFWVHNFFLRLTENFVQLDTAIILNDCIVSVHCNTGWSKEENKAKKREFFVAMNHLGFVFNGVLYDAHSWESIHVRFQLYFLPGIHYMAPSNFLEKLVLPGSEIW